MNILSKLLQFQLVPQSFHRVHTNQLKSCQKCLENFFNMFSFPTVVTDTDYNPILSNKSFTHDENLNSDLISLISVVENWCKVSIKDDSGNEIGFMFFRQDVSSEDIKENRLTSSLFDTFKYFLEKSSDVLWQCDIFFNVIFVSGSIKKFLGYTPEEYKKLKTENIYFKEHGKRIINVFKKIVNDYESGKAIDEEYLFELKFKHKNGFYKWGELKANPVFDKNDKLVGIQGIIRDIDEKKKKEEEIFNLRKLEALGKLAGGIAHDFNNILTGILGNVSLAKLGVDEKSRIFSLLENAEKSVGRAKVLTSQLLTFSKGGEPVIERVNLKDILPDYINFLFSGKSIKPVLEIEDDLWKTDIDKEQFLNVVQNIVLNACEASPQGGTVYISCKNFEKKDDESGFPLEPGNFIEIMIRDEGEGIPESVGEQIFDPFFSTKRKKTGLGLTIAYSIMKNHGGYIFFNSLIGKGTTFYIYLPVEANEKGDNADRIDKKLLLRNKKILVMDDEENIRDFIKNFFTIYNAKVFTAANGEEAIEIYQKENNIDVVITDLTVPGGMGGEELVKKILEINNNAKVIVSSGYSRDPIMQHYKEYGFCNVLTKPYKISELIQVMKDAL